MERIPLFPLNTVLFPRQSFPLHIFEERYKLMVNRCIEQSMPFGIVLIKSGDEVGGDAEPCAVGTTADITTVQKLEDGRMNLIAVGKQRFRIVELDRGEPYLQADVEFLDTVDAVDDGVPALAEEIASLLGEHLRLVMSISGQWTRNVSLPGEPSQLGDFVASQIDLSNDVRQQLLEELSLPERLGQVRRLLAESVRALQERWEETRKQRFAGAALN